MTPSLALYFLGTPQLSLDNTSIPVERRKAVALLAYLAVNRTAHTRETLSALLWPDYEQSKAFTNLRHTLWEIGQSVGEGWLDTSRDKIGLNRQTDIWLDVTQFKSLLEQSRAQKDVSLRIPLLADSAKLYRNHFLTGFSLKDAYPFNEWAYAESEELRLKLADALTLLSKDYCSLNEAEKAIPYARRLITLDPLNEASHRQLMDVYIQAGQHSAALKQYQTCEQILRKELGLDPQPETLALYKKIRKGEIKPAQVVKPTETVTPKHNLPSQLSSFIGREKEQNEVINLIAKNRLVTLVGIGGIGKTSLALQVGHKLLNEYANGVWFIALDSLSDPKLVPQAVASVFDIRETPARPVIEILTNVLREKTTLLILDNCEHLLDACAQLITTLLQDCPHLKILVASREVLNVTGEAIYQTPSLSMPAQDEASLERLTEYESIRLFTERATLAFSSFALTKENAQAVIDICRRVDGIPLALELAAARVNILNVTEILKQLQDSFALLSTDNRTALSRHQTLQASLVWSWGLLNDAEQSFVRQLAVFAGGWTLESAQAVCDGDALSLTDALVKKSLIVVDQETGRGTRYHFHEIVRQYAREKLVESGEEGKIRDRHLKYFLKLSEQAENALRGPEQAKWFSWLFDERDNLRAALEQAAKTDIEAGLYLSARLEQLWKNSNMREGTRWLAEFLQRPESKTYPLARAKALRVQGEFFRLYQQFSQARDAEEESLALFRASGDQQGEIDALLELADLGESEGDIRHYEKALTLAESLGDRWRQANVFLRLGWLHDKGQRASFTYWEKAALLLHEVGDYSSEANTHSLLGLFRILNGDVELAQKHLNEAELFWRSNKRADIFDNIKSAKSLIALMKGDYEQARALLRETIAMSEETGNLMSYLWVRVRLGYVALHEGNLSEARSTFAEIAQEFQRDQDTGGVVFTLEGMAGLYVAVGKTERAAQLIGWADATREKFKNTRPKLEQADVDKIIAACLARMGSSAFEIAYDEGREMTLDEAVTLALGSKNE